MNKDKKSWYLNISFWVILCIVMIAVLPTIANTILQNVFHVDASLSLGDAMEYYGAVIGFVGTVALGIIALYQNYAFKNESERLMQLQNAPYFSFVKLENFVMSSYDDEKTDDLDKYVYVLSENKSTLVGLEFDMKNISKYPICSIKYKGQVFDTNTKEWISILQNDKTKNVIVEPNNIERQTILFTPIWFDNICQAAFPTCSKNVFGLLVEFTNTFGLVTYGRVVVYKDGRDITYRMLPLGMFKDKSNKEINKKENGEVEE